ncbi:MAG: hypothetical protein WED82_02070 [Balneolales bacterium]
MSTIKTIDRALNEAFEASGELENSPIPGESENAGAGLDDQLTTDNLVSMMVITSSMIKNGKMKEAERNLELIRNAIHRLNAVRTQLDFDQKIIPVDV